MAERKLLNINLLRWISRIWSLLLVFFAVVLIFGDDSNLTGEIYYYDYLLLAILGIYIIGLIIAWKWEYIGGMISSITIAIFMVLFWIFVGFFIYAILAFLVLIVPPALIFLYCGWKTKNP